MNLTELRKQAKKRKKPVRKGMGPGTGKGTYSGRGVKGYQSRSGSKQRLFSEGGQMPLYRRLPKRGFSNVRFEAQTVHINVSELARFDEGATVTPQDLRAAGVVKGRFDKLRVLGKGEVKHKLEVHAHHFTGAAKEKIEAAGGTCVLLEHGKRRPKKVKKEKKTLEEKTGE